MHLFRVCLNMCMCVVVVVVAGGVQAAVGLAARLHKPWTLFLGHDSLGRGAE